MLYFFNYRGDQRVHALLRAEGRRAKELARRLRHHRVVTLGLLLFNRLLEQHPAMRQLQSRNTVSGRGGLTCLRASAML